MAMASCYPPACALKLAASALRAFDQLHARSTQLGPRSSRPDTGPRTFSSWRFLLVSLAQEDRFYFRDRFTFDHGRPCLRPFLAAVWTTPANCGPANDKTWLRPRNETSTKRICRGRKPTVGNLPRARNRTRIRPRRRVRSRPGFLPNQEDGGKHGAFQTNQPGPPPRTSRCAGVPIGAYRPAYEAGGGPTRYRVATARGSAAGGTEIG